MRKFLLLLFFSWSTLSAGFSYKTPVYTGVGSTRKASSLVVGDTVLSFALESGLTVSKEIKITKITKKSSSKVVFIKTSTGIMCVTPHEMFYNPKRNVWVSALNLKTTDVLLDSNVNSVKIKKVSVVTLDYPIDTYDFVTEQPHMFFLGTGGGSVLVHNAGFWNKWGSYLAAAGVAAGSLAIAATTTAATATATMIPAAAATAAGLGIATGGATAGVATTAGITGVVSFVSAPVTLPLAAVGAGAGLAYVGCKAISGLVKKPSKEELEKYLKDLSRAPKVVRDETKHIAKQVAKAPKIIKDETKHIAKQAHRTARKLRNFTRKLVKRKSRRIAEAVPQIEGLDGILEGAKPSDGNKSKSKTKEYKKPAAGGQKEKDKAKLNPTGEKEAKPGVKISKIPNGIVTDRSTSSEKMSTLEIQRKRADGKTIEYIKIRYI